MTWTWDTEDNGPHDWHVIDVLRPLYVKIKIITVLSLVQFSSLILFTTTITVYKENGSWLDKTKRNTPEIKEQTTKDLEEWILNFKLLLSVTLKILSYFYKVVLNLPYNSSTLFFPDPLKGLSFENKEFILTLVTIHLTPNRPLDREVQNLENIERERCHTVTRKLNHHRHLFNVLEGSTLARILSLLTLLLLLTLNERVSLCFPLLQHHRTYFSYREEGRKVDMWIIGR